MPFRDCLEWSSIPAHSTPFVLYGYRMFVHSKSKDNIIWRIYINRPIGWHVCVRVCECFTMSSVWNPALYSHLSGELCTIDKCVETPHNMRDVAQIFRYYYYHCCCHPLAFPYMCQQQKNRPYIEKHMRDYRYVCISPPGRSHYRVRFIVYDEKGGERATSKRVQNHKVFCVRYE